MRANMDALFTTFVVQDVSLIVRCSFVVVVSQDVLLSDGTYVDYHFVKRDRVKSIWNRISPK